MIKTIVKLDKKCSMVVILYLFFASFWLLNGFDKHFNGDFRHDTNPGVAKMAALNAETGELEYRIHRYRVFGFFGANRNEAFREYFAQLGLNYETSQFFLYLISSIEIVLGFAFLYIFFHTLIKPEYNKTTLFGTRVLHRLCFKASTLLFLSFLIFANLVGDRAENLEFSTFMILMLVSYWTFITASKVEREEYNQTMAAYQGERSRRKSENGGYTGTDRRAPREKHLDHAHH